MQAVMVNCDYRFAGCTIKIIQGWDKEKPSCCSEGIKNV